MRVDVYLAPSELTPAALDGRVVAVIDVLRATTTIAAALHAGARTVAPFVETEDAVRAARQFERGEVTLAGERNMVVIPGFHLGNSPLEFTSAAVKDRTVLLTTTNGTRALLAVEDAKAVYAASFVNFSVTVERLAAALAAGQPVAIVCAASEGEMALEDAGCAGRYVRRLRELHPATAGNDGAVLAELLAAHYGDDIVGLFGAASHGAALLAAGFDDDLHVCASVDLYPVLAEYRERAVRRAAPGAATARGA
ncbi:MAG: 2-phosphosulfolactate phosphatase [Gemmatimonadaceae bacterium]|nr:2-phosphosulfolactate phosphatase [Gemmatimonadaceae bacterium]